MRPKRVLGYARVSSAEQALGTSLEDQQNVINGYAAKRGLNVDRMFVEAESAVREKIERRVQIRALLADVREGDLVLCDKIDRWSRDPEFTYRSMREILSKRANFYAISDDCDPSTPNGDSMMGIRIYLAREDHKRIKVRLVGTRRLLRDRGLYAEGTPPWGYRRQVDRLKRNVLVVDNDEAALVRDVFRRCIAGESMQAISNALGVKIDRVKDALDRRFYIGEIRNTAGEWIRGTHPPLIEPHTFVAARASIESRRLGERRSIAQSETASWWLRDIARCALCAAKMAAAYAGPKDQRRRYYFRCFAKCTTRFVPVRIAETQADPMVLARLTEVRDEIASAGGAGRSTAATTGPTIEHKREQLERRRLAYVDAYSLGGMSRDELRERLEKLDKERIKVEAAAYVPPPIAPKQEAAALRNVLKLTLAWARTPPTERRVVVAGLAKAVFLAAGEAPRFEWFSVEEIVRRASEGGD